MPSHLPRMWSILVLPSEPGGLTDPIRGPVDRNTINHDAHHIYPGLGLSLTLCLPQWSPDGAVRRKKGESSIASDVSIGLSLLFPFSFVLVRSPGVYRTHSIRTLYTASWPTPPTLVVTRHTIEFNPYSLTGPSVPNTRDQTSEPGRLSA
ncbi:hypothetical protein BO71DRAFT_56698 [Aspergillus ellipticus CBS 707.79]|uniref:Uncharacterized protein n=1 Tax=Aspergillus ellipticus CBS 707.79 TaxID=1448320 RepID=A0A319D1Q2_9EURO|nr:hypothetical protein BO71DRAFT_56698 [Aspergillus ellipticus CBS 707.79]